MVVHVHASERLRSDAVEHHAHERVNHALGRFAPRLTRVDVYVSDENSHKHGPLDKRCAVEARPAGMDPIAVEHFAADVYKVVSEATEKMQRALENRFDRSDHR